MFGKVFRRMFAPIKPLPFRGGVGVGSVRLKQAWSERTDPTPSPSPKGAGSLLVLALTFSAALTTPVLAQSNEPDEHDAQMRAAWVEACEDWADWDQPGPLFRIHGNTWYVGTCGISAIFIAGHDEHVLIDSGTDAGAQVVLDNLLALAVDPVDIGLLLASHEHHDHVGGMARIQQASGALLMVGPESGDSYTTGRAAPADPQFAIFEPFAPVMTDEGLEGKSLISFDILEIDSIFTPGHTPGARSYRWESCDDTRCLTIVYADSLSAISADGYRFSDHPEYVEAFRDGLALLMDLDCDLLLTPHPSASGMRDKLLAGDLTSGMNCAEYAELQDARLTQRLAEEAQGVQGAQ